MLVWDFHYGCLKELSLGPDWRDFKNTTKKAGYEMVITPHIGNKKLYVQSGHYDKYGESTFFPIKTPKEDEEFY